MSHKAPAGSPSDERLETREWIVFVFRNEDKKRGILQSMQQQKNMADWKISHARVITPAIRKSFA